MAEETPVRELLATNDPVLISFASAVLGDEGIEVLVADQHMSVLEGSLGILPRRMLVTAADLFRARVALTTAGVERHLLTRHPDVSAGQ
jgi:Putative prokaryotic signal transducing protein